MQEKWWKLRAIDNKCAYILDRLLFKFLLTEDFLKISIITVALNSEATVLQALESVDRQQNVEVEYIFIDGQSDDNTVQIVKSQHSLVDHFISEPDRGIYDAMNKGLAIANGEVIGILNSDDFYIDSDVLSQVIILFQADPCLEVVMGGVDFVSNTNLNHSVREVGAVGFSPWMLRFGFMPPHPAIFIRKSTYDRVGNYKIDYKIAADFEFLIRLLLINSARYKVVNKLWVRMRTGGASTSGWRSMLTITHEMLRGLRENGFMSCTAILLLRLPIKFIRQVLL